MVDDIKEHYDNYDAFIIIHGKPIIIVVIVNIASDLLINTLTGTDTMAYTASGLSFLIENLGKTIILTGSQLPLAVRLLAQRV